MDRGDTKLQSFSHQSFKIGKIIKEWHTNNIQLLCQNTQYLDILEFESRTRHNDDNVSKFKQRSEIQETRAH